MGVIIIINNTVAVIDIGSNSIRLMVAKIEEQSIKELVKKLETTRMGEGLGESGYIKPDAIYKSLSVLSHYLDVIENYGARLCSVIGTSALREASNSKDFLRKVKQELGIEVEVISGTKEALLSAKGALYDKTPEKYLVFDLGGGSLELINKEAEFVKSIQVGAVKMYEKFSDYSGYVDLDKIYNEVIKVLETNIEYNKLGLDGKQYLVGVGGTATTFPMLEQKLIQYDHNKIQEYYISKERIYDITLRLNRLSIEERRKVAGMPKDREDIIVSGGGVIWALLDYLSYDGYYASDRDLLYGMIYEEISRWLNT